MKKIRMAVKSLLLTVLAAAVSFPCLIAGAQTGEQIAGY